MNHSCCHGCYSGCCPYHRMQELSRMCSCAPGVLAQNISACDCFCRPQPCGCDTSRSCNCGCRRR